MAGQKGEKIVSAAWVAGALYFPFALALFLYPVDIFVNNLTEYAGDLDTIRPLLAAALALALVSLAAGVALAFANVRGLWTVASFAACLGMYFVVSDLIAPVSVDRHIGFDGSESILRPPSIQIALDIGVSLLIGFLFFRLRGPAFAKMVTTFAAVFLGMNVVGDLQTYWTSRGVSATDGLADEQWAVKSPPPAAPADHPNVYHLVLDGFQGTMLPRAMELAGLTGGDLDGFIYFPKNRSNYDGTQMSFPSFMSGSIYRSGDLSRWMYDWYSSGMWNLIQEAQPTNLQIYADHAAYEPTPYNLHRKMTDELFGAQRTRHFSDIIFHLSLAKVAPSYLQPLVFRNGSGVWSPPPPERAQAVEPRLQPFSLMQSDESERHPTGQYVFTHVFVPHSPYVLDEHCAVHAIDSFADSYVRQAACALRLVDEFLDTLRRLGRYDNSAILIHADHGWAEGEPIEPLSGSSDEARIPIVDVTEAADQPRTAKHLDTFTAALLLVKPPANDRVAMVTSRASTQLLDIPSTVFDMLDLNLTVPEGMSVLQEDYPESAARHVYPGFRRWDRELGKQAWVGEDVMEGGLNHFSWTSGRGWVVHPNIPFRWEIPVSERLTTALGVEVVAIPGEKNQHVVRVPRSAVDLSRIDGVIETDVGYSVGLTLATGEMVGLRFEIPVTERLATALGVEVVEIPGERNQYLVRARRIAVDLSQIDGVTNTDVGYSVGITLSSGETIGLRFEP